MVSPQPVPFSLPLLSSSLIVPQVCDQALVCLFKYSHQMGQQQRQPFTAAPSMAPLPPSPPNHVCCLVALGAACCSHAEDLIAVIKQAARQAMDGGSSRGGGHGSSAGNMAGGNQGGAGGGGGHGPEVALLRANRKQLSRLRMTATAFWESHRELVSALGELGGDGSINGGGGGGRTGGGHKPAGKLGGDGPDGGNPHGSSEKEVSAGDRAIRRAAVQVSRQLAAAEARAGETLAAPDPGIAGSRPASGGVVPPPGSPAALMIGSSGGEKAVRYCSMVDIDGDPMDLLAGFDSGDEDEEGGGRRFDEEEADEEDDDVDDPGLYLDLDLDPGVDLSQQGRGQSGAAPGPCLVAGETRLTASATAAAAAAADIPSKKKQKVAASAIAAAAADIPSKKKQKAVAPSLAKHASPPKAPKAGAQGKPKAAAAPPHSADSPGKGKNLNPLLPRLAAQGEQQVGGGTASPPRGEGGRFRAASAVASAPNSREDSRPVSHPPFQPAPLPRGDKLPRHKAGAAVTTAAVSPAPLPVQPTEAERHQAKKRQKHAVELSDTATATAAAVRTSSARTASPLPSSSLPPPRQIHGQRAQSRAISQPLIAAVGRRSPKGGVASRTDMPGGMAAAAVRAGRAAAEVAAATASPSRPPSERPLSVNQSGTAAMDRQQQQRPAATAGGSQSMHPAGGGGGSAPVPRRIQPVPLADGGGTTAAPTRIVGAIASPGAVPKLGPLGLPPGRLLGSRDAGSGAAGPSSQGAATSDRQEEGRVGGHAGKKRSRQQQQSAPSMAMGPPPTWTGDLPAVGVKAGAKKAKKRDDGGVATGSSDGRRLGGGSGGFPSGGEGGSATLLNGSFPFSTETAAAAGGDKGGPSAGPSGGKKAGGKKGKKQTKAKKGAVATKRSSHPFVAACERELEEASPGEKE